MKIAVLAGGLSPERDVSLTSGALIAASLIRSGHEVALIDVYIGVPYVSGVGSLFTKIPPNIPDVGESEPDIEKIIRENGGRRQLIGPNVLQICSAADVVFIGLHGGMGENGQLQATLDNYGIRYTGSDFDGSLLAMDKELTKKIITGEGIPNAPAVSGRSAEITPERIISEIGLPCVVKPCACGSSVGVSIVKDRAGLEEALQQAELYGDRVVVEKMIRGREFSVGVLGGRALPPIEIIPKDGFYDYKNKYQGGRTSEICPAELSEKDVRRVGELSMRVFSALRLRGYARIDFIRGEDDGEFYCLEANTLPGMTPMSLLPQEAAAVGIGYDRLCEMICELGLCAN